MKAEIKILDDLEEGLEDGCGVTDAGWPFLGSRVTNPMHFDGNPDPA